MKREMRRLFDYLVNFCFIYFLLHDEELSFYFQFFSFNCNFDFFVSNGNAFIQATIRFFTAKCEILQLCPSGRSFFTVK